MVFLIVLLSLTGCGPQRTVQPIAIPSATSDLEAQVEPALKYVLRNFEEAKLRSYPEMSIQLTQAAKRLEFRDLKPGEMRVLQQAIKDNNPHKSYFAMELLTNHRAMGKIVETRARAFLLADDPDLQWCGAWILLKKSRTSPLETTSLERLGDSLNRVLDSPQENQNAHIQLLLKVFLDAENEEVAAKAVLRSLPKLLPLIDFQERNAHSPILRAVLVLLSRAGGEQKIEARRQLELLQEKDVGIFENEIKSALSRLSNS